MQFQLFLGLTILVQSIMGQINFPTCNQTYTACAQETTCNGLLGSPSYTSCTGSNGCQTFGLNYNNIVSEFFCEDNCLANTNSQSNNDFVNFQSCVSNLITQDLCSKALTNCQNNTGVNNCAPLIQTQSNANCLNTNPACNIT